MGLTRVLIIAVGIWLVIVFLRRQRRRRPPARQEAKLVRCAQCGVYLPEHETRSREDKARICAHH
jgi:Pyruvate/2-oxoacid:ferredoxin oxidoreductase delta subunit